MTEHPIAAPSGAINGARWGPIPWRGLVAGPVGAGMVAWIIEAVFGSDARWAVLYLPLFVTVWTVTVVAALRVLRARMALAFTALGVLVGGGWMLDIAYYAGTAEWNLALLVASAGGVALAEWGLTAPNWAKTAVGCAVLVAGLWSVSIISHEVEQGRVEAIRAELPAPYTVQVEGWVPESIWRVPEAKSTTTELRVDDVDGEQGVVRLTTHDRRRTARTMCEASGLPCRTVDGLWMSDAGTV